ncbi:hypothetical protein [Roseococcus sp. YIM B11640]|uniref:hypothetical protein n=1 Tax=Roseococcus sp. YIM B11640 TaxID=3133973 RepID=UPI003C79BBA7
MITFGPFAVGRDGSLTPRGGLRPTLRFRWRGRSCEATLTGESLQLRAVAGRIPSTAEPNADRARTLRDVADLPAELPAGWRLRLTPDHRLTLETGAGPSATIVAMMTEMVGFALALDPYLERLEAVGASGGIGTEKTWPG